ncbi:hypothetical protein QTP88_012806 [Uroleucon formosanum]
MGQVVYEYILVIAKEGLPQPIDEELIIIALMLDEEQENNCKTIKKRKRTVWVHDLWKKRQTEGEFTIYNGLIDDEQMNIDNKRKPL